MRGLVIKNGQFMAHFIVLLHTLYLINCVHYIALVDVVLFVKSVES